MVGDTLEARLAHVRASCQPLEPINSVRASPTVSGRFELPSGQTKSRDVDLTYSSRGLGTPVLVLPHYGESAKMMVPFFIELEKIARVSYMELPDIRKFRNLPNNGGKTPYYPIDILVEAFEEPICAGREYPHWLALRASR